MYDLSTKVEYDVYVSTLLMLARDANKQNETDAARFIASYLHGLVPAEQLDGFYEAPRKATAAPVSPPPSPAPAPTPALKTASVAAPVRVVTRSVNLPPQQSTTLSW